MSLHIIIRGAGLNLQANVKDQALNELMRLLQEHRDDTGDPACWPGGVPGIQRPRPAGPAPALSASVGKTAPTAQEKEARARLSSTNAPPIKRLEDATFPEKMLLLVAWIESKDRVFELRRPMLMRLFARAGEEPPANPKRDFMAAVHSGWLTEPSGHPLTASVTPDGWRRVATMLGAGRV